MIDCTCVVQQGQAPDQVRHTIENRLESFTAASFGQSARIAWVPVAPGNGFTAGKPSTSSIVSLVANKPLGSDKRELLLRELVDLWTGETGCSVDEVVAVIADPNPS